MIRYAMEQLISWKESRNRKPLIIRGARQVGKTWLMKEFGRLHFKRVAYINFDDNERMSSLFEGSLDVRRLITVLQIESDTIIDPADTLIIFDEVQEVPRALTSLKYFNENAPDYAIVAAGSLLGIALHQGTSFPVGKVEFLDLHPMSFTEFLEAVGKGRFVKPVQDGDFEMTKPFRDVYVDALRQYYYVGGMPEVVAVFAEEQNFNETRRVQTQILEAYEQDFSKHAPHEIVPRIRMLWNSIPAQLAKENRKFVYGRIQKGARAKDFELAMQWMLDCGLIHKVSRVAKPDMPLTAYQDRGAFKLYMLDVGLLSAKAELDVKSLLEGNRVFEEFKGALTEQYVLQQLLSDCKLRPFYWTAERASAEVDFVFQHGSGIVPLEVKAEENLKAKSLKQYVEKFKPMLAVRTSMSGYRKEDWLVNLPLYAISGIIKTLDESPRK